MLILAFSEYLAQAQRLATALDIQVQEVLLHHYCFIIFLMVKV
jgi:hypothetical protein